MGPLTCLSLAFLSLLIAGAEGSACPSGWLFYQGSCYGLFQERVTWAEAEIDCQSQGRNGHLASIASQAEGAVLARHIMTYQKECVNVWIGLFDYNKNGRWRWSDRSMVNYKAWWPNMPDNYQQTGEYCVELFCHSRYVKWNDVVCKEERPYICKFDL